MALRSSITGNAPLSANGRVSAVADTLLNRQFERFTLVIMGTKEDRIAQLQQRTIDDLSQLLKDRMKRLQFFERVNAPASIIDANQTLVVECSAILLEKVGKN